MIRKSVACKIKERQIDIMDEYKKIESFLNKYYNHFSLYEHLCRSFNYYEPYNTSFCDLNDLLNEYTQNLDNKIEFNEEFGYLPEYKQEEIINEFIDYCEIILQLTTYGLVHKILSSDELLRRLSILITNDLSKLGYKYKINEENKDEIIIYKENPIAETAAEVAESNISNLIYEYLSIRDDMDEKRRVLLDIINKIKPIFIKYKSDKTIDSIERYSQLLRHPIEYKNKEKYKWYFDNEEKYIDDIFMMCVSAINISESKEKIKEFNEKIN